MRILMAVLLLATFGAARAETLYVTDKLYLGVYQSKNGKQITSITSGTALEVLEKETSWVKARLADGQEGWVKSKYLVEKEPAAITLERVEKELEALKTGDAGEELEGLRAEKASLEDRLQGSQQEIDALRKQLDAAQAAQMQSAEQAPSEEAVEAPAASEPAEPVASTPAEAPAAEIDTEQLEAAKADFASQLAEKQSELERALAEKQQISEQLEGAQQRIAGALAALGAEGFDAALLRNLPRAAPAAESETASTSGFLAQLGLQRHLHTLYIALAVATLAIGFWLGVRFVDRRIRRRHGGMRVW
jgi:uncharacterized protein YgiM (DUF1202 family)